MNQLIDPIARVLDEAAWSDKSAATGRSVALWRNRKARSLKMAREVLLVVVGLQEK